MAKRKAARSSAGRKKTAGRKAAGRARKATRTRKATRKSAKASTRTTKKSARPARKRSAARPAARKAGSKAASVPAKTRSRRSAARKGGRKGTSKATARARPAGSKNAVVPVRKAPALNRERRLVVDDDIVQTPPSSLDLDRTASAARTGRRALKERFSEHTETSPALTAGDVDADWESAYSVGDEAPGGDNPTPDQDIVDDIGRAVGNEYQDTEELKGAKKIEQRDRNRWELDPASSEDWKDR